MQKTRLWFGVTSMIATISSASAGTLIATSGNQHIPLLELYSSEGCSSCPPADQWISTFNNNPDLWKGFVPIVFHVDYWNRLGWKDELSSSSMTERQRNYSHLWGTETVYTPGVVLDGKEWKGWQGTTTIKNNQQSAPIKLSLYREADHSFTVKVDQGKGSRRLVIKIAELGMGIHSNVTSGENSGQILIHNFVVLNWDNKNLSADETEAHFKLNTIEKPNQKSTKHAIAAWIEEEGNPSPLQAVGGYL